MKAIKSLLAGVALVASTSAFATPVTLGGESPDLQQVINSLYTAAGTSTALAPDVNLDQVHRSRGIPDRSFGRFSIEP